MNIEKYDELGARATADLEKLFRGEKVMAQQVIKSELSQMVDEGKALIFTDEEERLIRSFRRFKSRCKNGDVFKWQTRRAEGEIITPEDGALIHDPQELSA